MKALLLANGRRPGIALVKEQQKDADIVLAIDGAAGLVKEYGIEIDALIGDLDSVRPEDLAHIEGKKTRIIKLPREKDETDTRAAFDEALRLGADEIVLLGALGHRFDHSYGNVLLLARALKLGIKAMIADEKNTLFAADGPVRLTGRPGDIVSVLPLTEGVVADASRGLKYPLKRLPIPTDNPVGVSNELTESEAEFEIISGVALIALSRD
jgi:thiamine pyrophosphokinase